MLTRIRARLALLAAILSWQGAARAEEKVTADAAVQLGRNGLALYQEGKWSEAFTRFKEANSTTYSPVFVLYMARCERNLSHLREAAAQLEELLARPPRSDAPISWGNAVRDGRAELAALRGRIPSLRISAKGVASATVDDTPVRPGDLVELNPGEHIVRSFSPEGHFGTRRVLLNEGEHEVIVTLAFDPASDPRPAQARATWQEPRPRPIAGSEKAWRTSAWITGSVGVAAAIVGTVTGLVAKSRLDSIRKQCDSQHCPKELESETERARLFANVSTAAFGIAGADLAFSVTFLVVPPWTTSAAIQ